MENTSDTTFRRRVPTANSRHKGASLVDSKAIHESGKMLNSRTIHYACTLSRSFFSISSTDSRVSIRHRSLQVFEIFDCGVDSLAFIRPYLTPQKPDPNFRPSDGQPGSKGQLRD